MPDPVLSGLLRINRLRLRAMRGALAPMNYVGVMHLIVLYLSKQPGASQDDIACYYAVDKTSVARDARRLEDMGHIRREIDPENRRKYRLYLTEAGETAVPELLRVYDAFAARLSQGIPPEEWQLLQKLLQKLEDNIT